MCSTGGTTLDEALDELASADLDGVGDAGLLDDITDLVAARNRLDAELTRRVRRADAVEAQGRDGMKTMPSWLRGHARLSPYAAKALERHGRALQYLPALAAAFAAGEVTAEQVDLAAQAVTPKHLAMAAEQGVDL